MSQSKSKLYLFILERTLGASEVAGVFSSVLACIKEVDAEDGQCDWVNWCDSYLILVSEYVSAALPSLTGASAKSSCKSVISEITSYLLKRLDQDGYSPDLTNALLVLAGGQQLPVEVKSTHQQLVSEQCPPLFINKIDSGTAVGTLGQDQEDIGRLPQTNLSAGTYFFRFLFD